MKLTSLFSKKLLLPWVLVLTTSSFVYAQSARPSQKLKQSITVNIIVQGRNELYRGSATGPSESIANPGIFQKINISSPIVGVPKSEFDLSRAVTSSANPLELAVRNAAAAFQQTLTQTENVAMLLPSMDKRLDGDKVIGFGFNRATLDMISPQEKNAVRTAMQSGFSDYVTYFNGFLQPLGFALDLDHIGIADSRNYDSTIVEKAGELDSVMGGIFRGEKYDNSDDYKWRLNLNTYTLRVEIGLKPSTPANN